MDSGAHLMARPTSPLNSETLSRKGKLPQGPVCIFSLNSFYKFFQSLIQICLFFSKSMEKFPGNLKASLQFKAMLTSNG